MNIMKEYNKLKVELDKMSRSIEDMKDRINRNINGEEKLDLIKIEWDPYCGEHYQMIKTNAKPYIIKKLTQQYTKALTHTEMFGLKREPHSFVQFIKDQGYKCQPISITTIKVCE